MPELPAPDLPEKKAPFVLPYLQDTPEAPRYEYQLPGLLQWLRDSADTYALVPKEQFDPCTPADSGHNYCFAFRLADGVELQLFAHGVSSVLVTVVHQNLSVRTEPRGDVNPFELARRVRDIVTEIYRRTREDAEQLTDWADFWALCFVEEADGLEPLRRKLYDRYFVLDQITGWLEPDGSPMPFDPDATPIYALMPLDKTVGEDAWFFQPQKEPHSGVIPV